MVQRWFLFQWDALKTWVTQGTWQTGSSFGFLAHGAGLPFCFLFHLSFVNTRVTKSQKLNSI